MKPRSFPFSMQLKKKNVVFGGGGPPSRVQDERGKEEGSRSNSFALADIRKRRGGGVINGPLARGEK